VWDKIVSKISHTLHIYFTSITLNRNTNLCIASHIAIVLKRAISFPCINQLVEQINEKSLSVAYLFFVLSTYECKWSIWDNTCHMFLDTLTFPIYKPKHHSCTYLVSGEDICFLTLKLLSFEPFKDIQVTYKTHTKHTPKHMKPT
jgi:hypothetical protein